MTENARIRFRLPCSSFFQSWPLRSWGAGGRQRPPTQQLQEFLTHFTVSSNQSETSLFGNDRYLGEIGPAGRQFAVVPGVIRLRVIHSHCRPREYHV